MSPGSQATIKAREKVRNPSRPRQRVDTRDPGLQARQAPGDRQVLVQDRVEAVAGRPAAGASTPYFRNGKATRSSTPGAVAEQEVAPVEERLEPRERRGHLGGQRGDHAGVGPAAPSSASIAFGARFQTRLNQATAMSACARCAGSAGHSGGSGCAPRARRGSPSSRRRPRRRPRGPARGPGRSARRAASGRRGSTSTHVTRHALAARAPARPARRSSSAGRDGRAAPSSARGQP